MTATRRALVAITWLIAVVVLSVSTVEGQRLLWAHGFTAWSSWALPLAVDCGLAVALIADQALSAHGVVGRWGTVLRYSTVGYAVVLNVGGPVLDGDAVRIVLHLFPPALLLTVVEAATEYQRLLATVPALSDGNGLSSSQLNTAAGLGSPAAATEIVPDPDPLMPVVAATVRELEDSGKSSARDAVGEVLRTAGYTVSTTRLSGLLRTVREPVLNGSGPSGRG